MPVGAKTLKQGRVQMIIMGIDPGFAITGYGIVKYEGNKFSPLDYGAVLTKAETPFAKRLLQLDEELAVVINKYKPQAIAIEELFFSKNIKTAIMAAHGRGVAMNVAARSGAEVFEYTPLQVKQAVVGYGRAEKAQVQQMVKAILNLPAIPNRMMCRCTRDCHMSRPLGKAGELGYM